MQDVEAGDDHDHSSSQAWKEDEVLAVLAVLVANIANMEEVGMAMRCFHSVELLNRHDSNVRRAV
jgi:hypothetical protein